MSKPITRNPKSSERFIEISHEGSVLYLGINVKCERFMGPGQKAKDKFKVPPTISDDDWWHKWVTRINVLSQPRGISRREKLEGKGNEL